MKINWIAIDADGMAYVYEHRPLFIPNSGVWWPINPEYHKFQLLGRAYEERIGNERASKELFKLCETN